MSDVVLVAIIGPAIGVAGAILGNVTGGWRSSQNEERRWHRQQCRDAYVDLIAAANLYQRLATAVHYTVAGDLDRVSRRDAAWEQQRLLSHAGLVVRLVGSKQVQPPLNQLLSHCFGTMWPLVVADTVTESDWKKAAAEDFARYYDGFVTAARMDLGLESLPPATKPPLMS